MRAVPLSDGEAVRPVAVGTAETRSEQRLSSDDNRSDGSAVGPDTS